jgi:hypothetical protein
MHFSAELEINNSTGIETLQRQLMRLAVVNLLVLGLAGVVLRFYPFTSFPFLYKNFLHGHSHFAFGGWVFPAIIALYLKHFPQLVVKISCRNWSRLSVLVLVSAYAMLVLFPIQGYKPLSIVFSTLSTLAGFWFAGNVLISLRYETPKPSTRFLKWAVIYLLLSSLGPFATGPLVAMGKQGSVLYFDAVYFYLHFQYNGFFTFAILSLLYAKLEQHGAAVNGTVAWKAFNLACIPAFALSVLWSKPSMVFNYVGAVAALLQVFGFVLIFKDLLSARAVFNLNLFARIAIGAFAFKLLLQLFSAIPYVAELAYQQRNLVIAYLHLVLVGFVSMFILGDVYSGMISGSLKKAIVSFVFFFALTEVLLLLTASSLQLPFSMLLLIFSAAQVISLIAMLIVCLRRNPAEEMVFFAHSLRS